MVAWLFICVDCAVRTLSLCCVIKEEASPAAITTDVTFRASSPPHIHIPFFVIQPLRVH